MTQLHPDLLKATKDNTAQRRRASFKVENIKTVDPVSLKKFEEANTELDKYDDKLKEDMKVFHDPKK